MKCSICIATCNRPQGLLKLLDSLAVQRGPQDMEMEWIIVDNDPSANAVSIVDNYKTNSNIRIIYRSQPVKNISLTRNLAVANASGEYILFIDDDEIAHPDWMEQIMQTALQSGADGVFGPVKPVYHSSTPAWICKGQFFEKPYATPPTGTPARAMWSGNCLIRKSLLDQESGPFDPSYGLTGGEDTYLFETLQNKGAHFIYCAEAIVYESVPQDRTTLSYLLRRGFKGGNLYSRRLIELGRYPKIWIRFALLGKAGCFAGIGLVMALFSSPHKVSAGRWAIRVASNVGKLWAVFGFYPQHYNRASHGKVGVE